MSTFNLYHLTLQPPSSISKVVYGNFSDPSAHEFAVIRGGYLEILQQDDHNPAKLRTKFRENSFGHLRNLATLRLSGHNRDLMVVTSDSGQLSFLKYNAQQSQFEKLNCESYGKTGVRRSVPGEYIAVDAQGRAVMVASLEKDKLVFAVNRNSEDQLFVHSPLEANKQHVLCRALVSCDVGFENPLFAALEVSYEDSTRTVFLVLYEVDLGLNHVVRKSQRAVDSTSNMLIPLPNKFNGLLVCSLRRGVEFMSIASTTTTAAGEDSVSPLGLALPHRSWDASPQRQQDVYITCFATFYKNEVFFALLHTERGDVFKYTLDSTTPKLVYLDTLHAPAVHMVLSRHGLLFCASEFGDHFVYEMTSLGDDMALPTTSFTPSPKLTHFAELDPLVSCAPICQFKVNDLAKEGGIQQVYTLTGRGNQSSAFRILRQGTPVEEEGLLRFALNKGDFLHHGVFCVMSTYVLCSLKDSTRLFVRRSSLLLEEAHAEEANNLFSLMEPTLACGAWQQEKDECIQVVRSGWRRINLSTKQVVEQFKLPPSKRVEHACVTLNQVVLTTNTFEVLYFDASLKERSRLDLQVEISCVDCDQGFVSVGTFSNVLHILSVPHLTALSSLKLVARPFSCKLLRSKRDVRLEVGLYNGVLVRSILDLTNSGAILDSRSHALGNKPVRVQRVSRSAGEEDISLACSSRMWVCWVHASPSPLSYRACDFVSSLNAEELVFAGPKNVLSVGRVDYLDRSCFHSQAIPVDHTPRRLVKHPKLDAFVTIEGDADSYLPPPSSESTTTTTTTTAAAAAAAATTTASMEKKSEDDMEMDEDVGSSAATTTTTSVAVVEDSSFMDKLREEYKRVGLPKQAVEQWSSVIRIIHPFATAVGQHCSQSIQLAPNEMAVSLEHCRFAQFDYILVGTVQNLQFHSNKEEAERRCFIKTYKVQAMGGQRLEFLHNTPVNDIPLALCFFDGRLLCGSGNSLILFDLGQKQLLRKCEIRSLPSLVAFIKPVSVDRVVVGDSQESLLFVHYSKVENTLSVFADDVLPRLCTVGELLDNNTCAGGDKFGNVFVLRLPPGATGTDPRSRASLARSTLWEAPIAPHKLECLAHFYVGEVITAMQRCVLAPGKTEVILYGTVCGTMGCLAPFSSREELDFFAQLELSMRKHYRNMLNRDHLQFRSYYAPVKCVVDGDLCEVFPKLPVLLQGKIAREMDRSVEDICRRLEEQRWQLLW